MAGIDSYVVSCLHFQNRVWTFAGTAQIDTAQYKFGTASLLLDGDSDYIYSNDSADFAFGTGSFTVDFWFRTTTVTGDHCIYDTRSSGAGSDGFVIHHNGTTLKVFSGGSDVITGASTLLVDTWYHCAIVGESGATVKLYLDGTQEGSTWTVAYNFTNNDCVIGKAMDVANYYFNGWLDEVRTSKGTARWTANFTPSAAAYADDANTVSLLHFDEADASTFTKDVAANWTMDGATQFYDETGKVWTAAGDAKLTTSEKRFGSAALALDGTGDYITTPASADFGFGSGDFTIDFWYRPTTETRQAICAFSSDWYLGLDFHYQGTRNVNAWASSNGSSWDLLTADLGGGESGIGAISLTLNDWNHVAYVRNGNNWMTFINGVKDVDKTKAGTLVDASAKSFRIGIWGNGAYHMSGWIDELRISKGIARWTANFTPPTKEYDPAETYEVPYLTDTDTPVAPSINHVFPPYLTDTDTPLAPSINHVFPPALTDTDTAMAPVYNYAIKMSVYATDTDTPVAPYFGQLVPLTAPLVDSDIPYPPTLSGIVIPRRRVKVNLV